MYADSSSQEDANGKCPYEALERFALHSVLIPVWSHGVAAVVDCCPLEASVSQRGSSWSTAGVIQCWTFSASTASRGQGILTSDQTLSEMKHNEKEVI